MNSIKDVLEFDVLGYKVKLKAGTQEFACPPEKAVAYVRDEAAKILDHSPHLDRGQAALLVALKLACEKFELESEYRQTVEDFGETAKGALKFIEEISPPAL
jgi:hypothetical protein